MKENPRYGATPALVVLLTMLLPALTHAEDGLAYDVSAGAGHSDNIARTDSNEQGETIATVGLKLSYDQQGAHVTTDVVSDFDYYNYLDDTYDSELVGTLAGKLDVALVDGRLHWFTTDSFGQVLGDPFLPSTPDNRDNLNYLTTGLASNIALGSQMLLNLGGSYSLSSYENLPLDSQATIEDLGLTRILSSSNSIGLNMRVSQVKYDNDVSSSGNYDMREAVLRYVLNSARLRLKLDGGYSEIDRGIGGTQGDLLFRIVGARELSPRSTLVFNGGQEFSNSGLAFSTQRLGAPISVDNLTTRQTAEGFVHRYASIGWDITGRRTQISLIGSWDDEAYEIDPSLDQSLTAISVSVRRDLSAALTLELNTLYGNGEFQAIGDYNETRTGVAIRWQFARTLGVALSLDHNQRNSDIATAEYSENRIWLTFNYGHGSPRSKMATADFGSGTGAE